MQVLYDKKSIKKGITPIKHLCGYVSWSPSGPSVEVRLPWECAARLSNDDVSSVVSGTDALLEVLILHQLRQETCTNRHSKRQMRSTTLRRFSLSSRSKSWTDFILIDVRTHAHTRTNICMHTNICLMNAHVNTLPLASECSERWVRINTLVRGICCQILARKMQWVIDFLLRVRFSLKN